MKVAAQYAIVALLVLGLTELLSLFGSRLLLTQRIVIEPPRADGYLEYLQQRDPLLGWPAPASMSAEKFDAAGSRITPAYPDPSSPSCVALFGDSFTWGEEVDPEHAYGNVLSQRLGCRVANYGVGGFGTDQAVLRYVERIDDPAPVVVLGHYADNILRNVNQLRDLTSGTRFGFKPRFVVDADGGLRQIPLPTLELADYLQVDQRAADLLPYEYFVPDRLGGPVRIRFPYTATLVRALFHFRIRSRIAGVPSYAPFYDVDHPSGALQVTEATMQYFADTARARGQTPVIVLIPDEKDLRLLGQGQPPAYSGLQAWLRERGLGGPDVAGYMVDQLAGRDVCELFVSCAGRSHYNIEGYAMLAAAVHQWLDSSALTGPRLHPGAGAVAGSGER